MPKRKLSKKAIKKKCIELNNEGMLLVEISKILGISLTDVFNNIKDSNLSTESDIELCHALSRDGMTRKDIAKNMGKSVSTVRRMLLKTKPALQPGSRYTYMLTPKELEKLKNMYLNNVKLKDIASTFNISKAAVEYRIYKSGIRRKQNLVTNAERKRMVKLHEKGYSIRKIAITMGRGRDTVKENIDKYYNKHGLK